MHVRLRAGPSRASGSGNRAGRGECHHRPPGRGSQARMTGAAGRNDPYFVILAAGISSRMKQGIEDSGTIHPSLLRDEKMKPKAMIGVGENRAPFLDYLLLNMCVSG